MIDRPTSSRDLVAQLRGSVDEVAEAALQQCERAMPFLTALPGRDRAAGLNVMRYSISLQLDLADGREATEEEEAYLRSYFGDAAERGVPLDVQLQIVRRTIAFTIHHYWQAAGPPYTDDMLVFSARTGRFHHRLEQLLVDAYCQHLGTDVVAGRLRRAHADALLNGDLPPPTGGALLPPASGYVVLVVPGGAGTPPPLPALSSDDRVLHTVRHGADVVLVPAEPDGQETAEKLTLRARDAGRTAAAAIPAPSPTAVPRAYSDARRLLDVAPALRTLPVLITPGDALPEQLLAAEPEVAGQLAALADRVAKVPGLFETLTAFLDTDLDRTATAERLHVHRRTLTQRLHRIRELTGHDPRSSRGVQVLGLALAAHGLRGAVAHASGA